MSAITKRRRLQFSLKTLLLVPAVLGLWWSLTTGIMWWVDWPDRTIDEFKRLIEADDFEAAATMLKCDGDYDVVVHREPMVRGGQYAYITIVNNDGSPPTFAPTCSQGWMTEDPTELSTRDMLLGRRRCYLDTYMFSPGRFGGRWAVTVQGGAMTLHPENLPDH